MDVFPPFAIGPHYLLSWGLASFIGNNAGRLKGVGTLEDVSVGYWMLGIGVKVEHVPWFTNARNEECIDSVVSLADLRPHGIWRVHDNVKKGKSICEGFERDWVREGASLSGMGENFYSENGRWLGEGDAKGEVKRERRNFAIGGGEA